MEVSKRTITTLVVVVLYLAACLSLGPDLRAPGLVELIATEGLTFEGALRIAERLDRIADELEVLPVGRAPEDLEYLTVEIVGYFAYEGISDRCYVPVVQWQVYPRDRNFHVAGSCTMGIRPRVALNARYANPWSSRWYNRVDMLAVLVHELAHAQGITGFDIYVEPAAQLATVEVLAAMVRDQNPIALVPLIRELQEYAEYYAMEIALRTGRMDEYRAHVRRVANSAYDVASWERAMDHWAGALGQLKAILSDYGRWPWIFLVTALRSGENLTRPFPCVPNDTGQIELNDLVYVLEHLGELVEDCPQVEPTRLFR